MDDVITTVQGGSEQHHQVFDSRVRDIKWLLPSLPVKYKDSVIVKKLLEVEGVWTCDKEVFGWIFYRETVTVAHPERKLQELRDLLAIPTTQLQMGRKELERLVRKIHSIYLVVPGVIAHLYHLQQAIA